MASLSLVICPLLTSDLMIVSFSKPVRSTNVVTVLSIVEVESLAPFVEEPPDGTVVEKALSWSTSALMSWSEVVFEALLAL